MSVAATVRCENCGAVLAEVAGDGLRAGPITVRPNRNRGFRVECRCGHTFRWHGPAADSRAEPLDIPDGTYQDT